MGGTALEGAAVLFVVYVALEPYVRRRWPHSLISWSRAIAGGIRDPLVGGHLLIGIAVGVGYTLLFLTGRVPGPLSALGLVDPVLDARRMPSILVLSLQTSVEYALVVCLLFFLLRVLLRRPWLAAVVFVVVVGGPLWLLSSPDLSLVAGGIAGIRAGFFIFMLTRFGVLPLIAGLFVRDFLLSVSLTTNLSTWYAGSTMFALASVLVLTAYAFHTAVAGRPLFKEGFLEAG